ncbi:hypothetical protein DEO72_LG11g1804 [Vigna unguiculata]|uniref:Uncharacterized protein n=1 Tax=Vigna unguiculata TaxID=3917 RepID=A0A4D6NN77_VIGUN|nr:hypothetical protein DEO72_LG11g1804 [Vigna unguiculata]
MFCSTIFPVPYCSGAVVLTLVGNSGDKRVFSPKRACLAQARLVETAQIILELSLRRRALPRRGTLSLGEGWPRSGEEGLASARILVPTTLTVGILAQARACRLSKRALSPERGFLA